MSGETIILSSVTVLLLAFFAVAMYKIDKSSRF